MKLKNISIFVLILAGNAFAQSPSPSPSLADNMDSISTLVKTITKNMNDATQNTASAAQAGQLVALFTKTLSQVPTMVSTLPANQQASAISGYQALIQKEIADAQALQKAFSSNNNAGAASILQDMNTLKSQGHSTYAK